MLTNIKQIFSPKIKHPYKTVQNFASCSHHFSNTINPLYMQQVKREMYEYVQSLSTKALCLYFLILVSNSYSQELEESIRLIMLEEIKKEIIQRYIPVSHPREKSLIYIYIYNTNKIHNETSNVDPFRHLITSFYASPNKKAYLRQAASLVRSVILNVDDVGLAHFYYEALFDQEYIDPIFMSAIVRVLEDEIIARVILDEHLEKVPSSDYEALLREECRPKARGP